MSRCSFSPALGEKEPLRSVPRRADWLETDFAHRAAAPLALGAVDPKRISPRARDTGRPAAY